MSRLRHISVSRLRALRGAIVVAALTLGASCAADTDDAPGAGATVPASTPAAGSTTPASTPAAGSTAPGSTPDEQGQALPLVGGGRLDLATIDDQPIALWFWAPG